MNYLSVAVLVGSLILLHEVGHLLVAKWCGIPIARFSVGFGRKLWSIQSGETEYRVAVFPFGGYVLPATTLDEFEELPLHHRVAFALGGPVANLAVAIGTVAMVYVFQFGLSLDMLLLRPLGQVSQLVVQLLSVLPVLFTQPDHLAGIVGVVALGGDYVGTDFLRLLELSVLLNVNLAVFNLLPFLPLDGGRIIMALGEHVYAPLRRCHVPFALMGWGVLIGLMVYATVSDIAKMATVVMI